MSELFTKEGLWDQLGGDEAFQYDGDYERRLAQIMSRHYRKVIAECWGDDWELQLDPEQELRGSPVDVLESLAKMAKRGWPMHLVWRAVNSAYRLRMLENIPGTIFSLMSPAGWDEAIIGYELPTAAGPSNTSQYVSTSTQSSPTLGAVFEMEEAPELEPPLEESVAEAPPPEAPPPEAPPAEAEAPPPVAETPPPDAPPAEAPPAEAPPAEAPPAEATAASRKGKKRRRALSLVSPLHSKRRNGCRTVGGSIHK